MNAQGIKNLNRARKIISILGGENNEALNRGALKGIQQACSDCDKWGPKNGGPCICLMMLKEMGIEYTTPDWCKDPGVDN